MRLPRLCPRWNTSSTTPTNGPSIKVFLLLSLSLARLLSSLVKPLLLFTEALLDSEEEVNVSPSRKARKVSICDVLAAPAEPDAPCDTPTKRAGGRGNEQTRKPESKPCTPLKHPGLLVMAALNPASQWALTYDRALEHPVNRGARSSPPWPPRPQQD